jgi:hypothetical protein
MTLLLTDAMPFEPTVDRAQNALRKCLDDLATTFENWQRVKTRPAEKTIAAAYNEMRPHLVTLSPDVRQAMEYLEFFDHLSSSLVTNVQVIIALALKLPSPEFMIQTVDESSIPADRLALEFTHHPTPGGSAQSEVQSMPKRRRGRPTKIPDELKRKALDVQGGKARAQILYQTNHPSPQQVKNTPTILRAFKRKSQSSDS